MTDYTIEEKKKYERIIYATPELELVYPMGGIIKFLQSIYPDLFMVYNHQTKLFELHAANDYKHSDGKKSSSFQFAVETIGEELIYRVSTGNIEKEGKHNILMRTRIADKHKEEAKKGEKEQMRRLVENEMTNHFKNHKIN